MDKLVGLCEVMVTRLDVQSICVGMWEKIRFLDNQILLDLDGRRGDIDMYLDDKLWIKFLCLDIV